MRKTSTFVFSFENGRTHSKGKQDLEAGTYEEAESDLKL